MLKSDAFNFNKLRNYADWKLLIFLILFLDVKLVVKLIAIILIFILRFDFKFGFSLKNSRLPLFYVLICGIAIFNCIIYLGFLNIKYDLVFLSGMGIWLLSLLAIHQLKLAVEKNDTDTLHRTISLYFLINIIVSLVTLASIIWEIKTINPYTYQGQYQKYFIGTGDFIKGITFDVSITNSVISAFGVVYFLTRKNAGMLLLCMSVLLFSGSNSVNILLMGVLFMLFIFRSTRNQKSLIVVCLMMVVVFMIKISPHNSNYAANAVNRMFHKRGPAIILVSTHTTPIMQTPDSLLNADERRQKLAKLYLDSLRIAALPKALPAAPAPVLAKTAPAAPATQKVLALPTPNLDTAPYWEAPDTTPMRRNLLNFIVTHKAVLPISGNHINTGSMPGKVIALKQLVGFMLHHPQKILTGNGLGNFSSKIALKATNMGFNGGYLKKYVYISPDFMANHLDVYLNFFSKEPGLHSVINNPNSVYCQLFGEYGILGLMVFFVFYLWYFLRHYRQLSYGIPILLLLLGVFFLEYWFEQLSVVVFAELLLLVNIKEAEPKPIKA